MHGESQPVVIVVVVVVVFVLLLLFVFQCQNLERGKLGEGELGESKTRARGEVGEEFNSSPCPFST